MLPWVIAALVGVVVIAAVIIYRSGVHGQAHKKTTKKDKPTSRLSGHYKDPLYLYLYHYTTEEGARGIRKARRINASRSAVQDAVFGDGVYLTSLHPLEGLSTIIANNYDDKNPNFVAQFPSFRDKANYFFRFLSSDLPGVSRTTYDRDVWRYPRDILLDNIDHVLGQTEKAAIMKTDTSGALRSITFS